MLRNKYIQIIIVALCCFAFGYFYKDTKIIVKTEEKIVYVKQNQNAHSVTTTEGGRTTTVTDTHTTTDTAQNSHSYTREEINAKRYTVQGAYLVGQKEQAFQVATLVSVIPNVNAGLGVHYNTVSKRAMGMLLVGWSF